MDHGDRYREPRQTGDPGPVVANADQQRQMGNGAEVELAAEYMPSGNTMLHRPASYLIGWRWTTWRQKRKISNKGIHQAPKAQRTCVSPEASAVAACITGRSAGSWRMEEPASTVIAVAPM